jgi:hypothetical protein
MKSSPSLPFNNPAMAGQAAARKRLFGEYSRYAVWPIHTRFGQLQWLVADAHVTDEVTGGPAVIRQEDTEEEAVAGLPL